jgi:predicted DNA-binding transcriptional regulator AlpA
MGERLLKIEEVALMIGVSVQTINIWYKWARTNPDNDYAKMLPTYKQMGTRQTRYWTQSDIWKLIEFNKVIPRGRNGVMGDVTQRRIK